VPYTLCPRRVATLGSAILTFALFSPPLPTVEGSTAALRIRRWPAPPRRALLSRLSRRARTAIRSVETSPAICSRIILRIIAANFPVQSSTFQLFTLHFRLIFTFFFLLRFHYRVVLFRKFGPRINCVYAYEVGGAGYSALRS